MRLIDADALEDSLGCADEDINFKYLLRDAPAIDAVPVVHGRWIICSDGYYPYCSECNSEPKSGLISNYCPNCGAKMDKEAHR